MSHTATLSPVTVGSPDRPGWVPGSITPGPMVAGPHHRVPLAPGVMQVDPAPMLRTQMPDGASAYASVPTPAPTRPVLPVEDEVDDEAPAAPQEHVGAGLARAALALPFGIIVAGAIWQFGYVASASALGLALAAAWLYAKGAGRSARRGALPLIALIAVGVALSLLACIALDVNSIYTAAATPAWPSRLGFLGQMATSPDFLAAYSRDALTFAAFGGLGALSVVFGMARSGRAA